MKSLVCEKYRVRPRAGAPEPDVDRLRPRAGAVEPWRAGVGPVGIGSMIPESLAAGAISSDGVVGVFSAACSSADADSGVGAGASAPMSC